MCCATPRIFFQSVRSNYSMEQEHLLFQFCEQFSKTNCWPLMSKIFLGLFTYISFIE
ncbi:hypothetical protein LLB_3391 [Legionella longbeachae D-4968]|nr:hypothetical protein LLB_3391 [Legionella longbeachae D-4968]